MSYWNEIYYNYLTLKIKKMKNLKLLSAVFAFVFAFSSCSKDEALTKQEMLTGKWEFSKTGYISDTGVETTTDYNHECTTQKDFYQFLEGGIYNEGYYSGCSLELSTGTWSLSENMLSRAFDGAVISGSWEIIELTSTTLKLKITYLKEIASPAKGAGTTGFGENIYIFTKA